MWNTYEILIFALFLFSFCYLEVEMLLYCYVQIEYNNMLIQYLTQQGPFRDVGQVLQQRYRPLEPTLRVATSFTSVERAREEIKRQEWAKGFQDDM